MTVALFVGFAAILVASSLLVILHRNPVTSALFLVLAFCSLAGIYLVMQAEFIGMVQIIVYAGAIMVLFLFVIMYLNLRTDVESGIQIAVRRGLGWVVGAVIVAEGVLFFTRGWGLGPVSTQPPPAVGNTQALGQVLYTRYLFPFEITSIVLLVAMIGAVVIARGHLSKRSGDAGSAARVRAPEPAPATVSTPALSDAPAAASVAEPAATPSGGAS